MNEGEFWIQVWKIVAATFSVFLLTVGGCTSYQAHLVRDAIAAGTDPIKASCAINGIGGSATAAVCAVVGSAR